MNDTQKNNLFYVCSLIEFIGRKTKNRRATIVKILGKKELGRQLELAEVNHLSSVREYHKLFPTTTILTQGVLSIDESG